MSALVTRANRWGGIAGGYLSVANFVHSIVEVGGGIADETLEM